MYDVDPAHTGNNDLNRGMARTSWADAMVQAGGSLRLKARRASAGEKALFEPGLNVANIGAMIHSATDLVFRAPFLIEFRATLSKAQALMGGYHPSFWLMQMGPARSGDGLEIDWEGESDLQQPNYFAWSGGSSAASKGAEFSAVYDGQPHTYGIEVGAGELKWYLDGAFVRTASHALAQPARPFYFLATSHIADFASDPYVDSQWQAAGDAGASIDFDYVRLWHAAQHRKPLVAPVEYAASCGQAFSFTLPTSTEVWGAEIAETVEAVIDESNSPGGNYAGGFAMWPAGVSYNASTRILSGTLSQPGTLVIVRYPTDGGSAKPHRMALHVGPKLPASLPPVSVGQAYACDLHALCDCGQLTTDASGQKAKTIGVSGLPAGLTYSDATGLVTGMPTATGGAPSVTVTNARGQQASGPVPFSAGLAPPVSAGLVGSLDPELAGTLTTSADGSDTRVDAIAGADGTTYVATATGAQRPKLVTANGRKGLRFTAAESNRMDWGNVAAAHGATFTRVSILDFASASATQCVIDTANPASGTSADRYDLLMTTTGPDMRARKASSSAIGDAVTPGALSDITTIRHILIEDYTTGNNPAYLRKDRGAAIAGTTVADPTGATATTIGARRSGGATPTYPVPYNGTLFRELVYNRNLTAGEKTQILDWATTNYGTL